MSNIVFKGDSVKNFGEYLLVPYVESITVTNPDEALLFEVQLSVFFLAEDEPNYENFQNVLDITKMFYRWGYQEQDKPLTKTQLVGPSDVRSTEITPSIPLETETFLQSEEEMYDSEERRVVKYTTTLNISITNLEAAREKNIYLYLFSTFPSITSLSDSVDRNILVTSDIAYEKVMSKGLIIKKEEKFVYFDQEGTKYSQVPLLGLDRNFYKTDTVTREMIAQRVSKLINRYKGGSAPGLSDSITSIEYVLSTEADTENLLVQLDKARRSFPNKTNNNPTGNLYASFAILLQNINSAFPVSERLIKDKYLTGKVFDLRDPPITNVLSSSTVSATVPYSRYINMPLVDRKMNYAEGFVGSLYSARLTATNTGLYLLDYENLVREKASIFKHFDVNRFFEICPDDKLSAYKAALFSKFKLAQIQIRVFTHGRIGPTSTIDDGRSLIPQPDDLDARDNQMINFTYGLREGDPFGGFTDSFGLVNSYNINQQNQQPGPNATNYLGNPASVKDISILNYNLADSGRQTFAIKYIYEDYLIRGSYYNLTQEIEGAVGITGQRHVFDTRWVDFTINMIFDYIEQFALSYSKLGEYLQQARDECSYNNITNNFNNFFVKSVKQYWENQLYTYPWEIAPTVYSILSYLRTDRFNSLDETRTYANEVMYNISPETGNLNQLEKFYELMLDFNETVIDELRSDMGPAQRPETVQESMIKNYRSNTEMFLSQRADESDFVTLGATELEDEEEDE